MTDAVESVAEMIGASFSGGAVATAAASPKTPELELTDEPFEFDAPFQTQITYLVVFDQTFMRRVAHLLKPSYFESAGEAALVSLALEHWKKYEAVMADRGVIAIVIKEALQQKRLKAEQIDTIKKTVGDILRLQADIRSGVELPLNSKFVADKIAEFAQNQEMISAITRSVNLLEKRDFDKVKKLVMDAAAVGINEDEAGGEYFERLAQRTNMRAEASVGRRPPRGITTGHPKLDALLYHRGWGKKELTVLMGGAKSGKTMALIEFASNAVMAGHNVLYVTLEVASDIVEERADARFTEIRIGDLVANFGTVNAKIDALATKAGRGKFYIAEYPSGTLSPAGLRGLLERHKAKGWNYDMVVVDYADLMQPNFRTQDPIENSRQIYVDLRAIGTEYNCSMLTATQSNREGYKAVTAKAENVADDFNKVRTADLFISINITEDERRDGKARLYFAASRNQQAGMTLFIQQDLACAKFLKMIERVE